MRKRYEILDSQGPDLGVGACDEANELSPWSMMTFRLNSLRRVPLLVRSAFFYMCIAARSGCYGDLNESERFHLVEGKAPFGGTAVFTVGRPEVIAQNSSLGTFISIDSICICNTYKDIGLISHGLLNCSPLSI